MLLDAEAFLSELAKMFQRSKTAASVYITMKRYDGRTKPIPKEAKRERQNSQSTPLEYKCLVRAQLRTKKISTVIPTKDVNRFQQAYTVLLRANIDNLKKIKKQKKATGAATTQ